MKPVWIAFICGFFFGGMAGIFIIGALTVSRINETASIPEVKVPVNGKGNEPAAFRRRVG